MRYRSLPRYPDAHKKIYLKILLERTTAAATLKWSCSGKCMPPQRTTFYASTLLSGWKHLGSIFPTSGAEHHIRKHWKKTVSTLCYNIFTWYFKAHYELPVRISFPVRIRSPQRYSRGIPQSVRPLGAFHIAFGLYFQWRWKTLRFRWTQCFGLWSSTRYNVLFVFALQNQA